MNKAGVFLFTLTTAAFGAVYGLSKYRASTEQPPTEEPLVILSSGRDHVASAEMVAAARSLESKDAPAFRAEAGDGRIYDLREIAKEGPLALFFIKDGCPCSIAAQPFYDRLYRAYGTRIKFFAVIDGDDRVARRWADRNRVSFPILCDPELRIVREYKAENSAYFAIVARGGAIERYWPGYSVGMLKEAGERLARLAGVDPKPIDATDAPDDLYSGCPF